MRIILLLITVILLPFSAHASSSDSHKSEYAGERSREIKSLSESDIDELRNGSGWGLAKAAELNGIPGPAHILEMKKEIELSPEQNGQIEALFAQMRGQAIELGTVLIDLERELNNHFARNTINEELLRGLLGQISQVRGQLRFVHLSTHLKTPDILTAEQIARYNELRGYSSNDPCIKIPAGHDAEMWKKHNNCP